MADDLFSRADEDEAAAEARAALDVVEGAKGTAAERRRNLAEATRKALIADTVLARVQADRRRGR